MLTVHLGCSRYTGEAEKSLVALKKAASEKLYRDFLIVKNGTMYKYELDPTEEREAFLAPFSRS